MLGRKRGGRRAGARALRDDGRKLVLHVGCGPFKRERLHERFRGPDWREVRLDIDPDVEPDIVCSIVDMASVASASVDAVWSSHNIEHVYAHEVPIVFGEFFRVLRPGGEVLLHTPDLARAAERIRTGRLEDAVYSSPAGPITALDIVYGFGDSIALGNAFMAHKTGFTARSLAQKLRDAGFGDVDVQRIGVAALSAAARKH